MAWFESGELTEYQKERKVLKEEKEEREKRKREERKEKEKKEKEEREEREERENNEKMKIEEKREEKKKELLFAHKLHKLNSSIISDDEFGKSYNQKIFMIYTSIMTDEAKKQTILLEEILKELRKT